MPCVIDSTLREGTQSASRPLTLAQTTTIAKLLVRAGVDAIEVGHPARGDADVAKIRAVSEVAGGVDVLAHARANPRDVQAVATSGAGWVGIFLGVNEISRQARLVGRSQSALHQMIFESVQLARDLGLMVRFTVEDATRTPLSELQSAFGVAVSAGASRLCLADTVGVGEPDEIGGLVRFVRQHHPEVAVEVHLHDDRGLALANALAAIDAGAEWVSTSVNGMGERAGIVDLAALAANLHFRGVRPMNDPVAVRELSRHVAAYSGLCPDTRRPVVGRDAFRHYARLHRLAVARNPTSYEWLSPDLFDVPQDEQQRFSADPQDWIVAPRAISATELRYHRDGPGQRYVAIDDRFVPGAGQYCIARRIPRLTDYGPGHVDPHAHDCDSLYVFLGDQDGYAGLTVEIALGGHRSTVESPVSAFIPAGVTHSYRVIDGSGTYINHVLAGSYNTSLLESEHHAVEVGGSDDAWDQLEIT